MFKNFFKKQIIENNPEPILEAEAKPKSKKETPENILRASGYKIKLVTPTSFGTQIDLFLVPHEDNMLEILDNYNIKIKGKSIFIIA